MSYSKRIFKTLPLLESFTYDTFYLNLSETRRHSSHLNFNYMNIFWTGSVEPCQRAENVEFRIDIRVRMCPKLEGGSTGST